WERPVSLFEMKRWVVNGESYAVSDFFFQAEDGIRGFHVTGVQTCALPISWNWRKSRSGTCRCTATTTTTTIRPSRASSRRRSPADRKSTRLNSSHVKISYAVFCLKKKNIDLIPFSRLSLADQLYKHGYFAS